MEIRFLRETDNRLAVSRIYEESWKFAYRGIIPQAYLDTIPIGRWAANRDLEGSLVLEEGGQLIGTARTGPSRWPKYPDSGEIVSLYLLPEFTGRGYGRPCWRRRWGLLRIRDTGMSSSGRWRRTAGPGGSMRKRDSSPPEILWTISSEGGPCGRFCTAAHGQRHH